MRIAHLPSSYVPDTVGGTELYVRHLCRGLADLGHQSAVVRHTGAPAPANWDGPEEPIRLPPHPPRRRADLYRQAAGVEPPGFRAFLADWRPDVVHFHAFTLGAGPDHARLLREAGIPYLVTYHTPAQSCPRGTLMRWGSVPCDGAILPRRCAACSLQARGWPRPAASALALSPVPWDLADGPWVTRVAVPSLVRELRDQWAEFFGGAVWVMACADFARQVLLANDLPADRVTVERQALPGDDRERTLRLPVRANGHPIRLGFFGRFTPVKGPDLLVEAVKLMRADGMDVTAELAGPIGDGDRVWADRVLSAGGNALRHVGVLAGDGLSRWLDSLDLVVLPSRWLETGPLTLLEAWDRGVPVVGTDLGGMRDFLAAAGLSDLGFPADDPPAVAAAVRRTMAWSGPAPVVRVPGIAGLARRMADLYESCLAPAA